MQSEGWRQFLEESEEAILLLDCHSWSCVAANPAACGLLGVSQEQLLQRSIADFIAPEQRQFLDFRRGEQLRQVQIMRPDGTVRSVEGTVILNRRLEQALWVLRDGLLPDGSLSEDALSEDAARELDDPAAGFDQDGRGNSPALDDRMRQELAAVISAFIESAPIGMMVLDRQLRCVMLNSALCTLSQTSVEDRLGQLIWDFLPGTAAQQIATVEQVLATGQSVLNLEVTADRVQQPGGDRAWLISYFPIQSGGEAIGVGVVVRDIVDVKRRQTRLERANADLAVQVEQQTAELEQSLRFEMMLKRITDKVRDSLDEAQILQTAVEELTQELETLSCDTGLYDLDDRVSLIAYESIQSDVSVAKGTIVQMSHYQEIYDQLLSGQYIHFCWLPDQIQVPVRFAAHRFTKLAVPLMDEQGVIGDMCLYRPHERPFQAAEIRLVQQCANQCAIALRQSRLYQAAQQQVHELERLHRLKDDFLNTVSHELRTPMSTLKMAVQMLELHLSSLGVLSDSSRPIASYFKILSEECDREILLINDLLDLARLDGETDLYQVMTIDLSTWLPHVAEVFQPRAINQQQQLTFAVDPDLPGLSTDLFYLERIVVELLTNACKYTPVQETIHLSAHVEGDCILIQVVNTGVEIPQAERDRIFEKFYRIPNSDPWRHGGTGLGLALIQKIAHRLGGTLQVDSGKQQGKSYTRFTLAIPQ